eukprot:6196917-Pleurochrysis_carterae.AAC.1
MQWQCRLAVSICVRRMTAERLKACSWRCRLAIRVGVRQWTAECLKACSGDLASPFVSACGNGLPSA